MPVLPQACLSGLTKTERYYQLYLVLGGEDDGCFFGNTFIDQLRLILALIGSEECIYTEWDFYAAWLEFLETGACVGLPLEGLQKAVYTILYDQAGDTSLTPPECFLGIPDDERDIAIILASGGDSPVGTDYFVASNGSDANDGTSILTPFLTIAKAVQVVVEGNSIGIRGGDTFAENVILPAGIYFRSYGTGRGIVAPVTGHGVMIENVSDVRVENIWVSGSSQVGGSPDPSLWITGIRVSNNAAPGDVMTGIVISDCEVSGFEVGIYGYCYNDNAWIIDGMQVTDNNVHDCRRHGINMEGSGYSPVVNHFTDTLIRGNTVDLIPGIPTVNTGNGIRLLHVAGTVDYNLVQRCGYLVGATGEGGPTGILISANQGPLLIEHNIVKRISSTSQLVDGLGIDTDGGAVGCTIRWNYIYNTDGAGLYDYISNGGNVFYGNVVINCARNNQAGMMSGSSAGLFYNNTVISTRGERPLINSESAVAHFYNNILLQAGAEGPILTGSFWLRLEGNLYWSRTGVVNMDGVFGLDNYRTITGYENAGGIPRGVEADPFIIIPDDESEFDLDDPSALPELLTYRGLQGSPAVGAGLDLQALFGVTPPPSDFNGATGVVSIGAYNTATPSAGPSVMLLAKFLEFTASWPIPSGVTDYEINIDGGGWTSIGLVGEFTDSIGIGVHSLQVRADGGVATTIEFEIVYNGLPEWLFNKSRLFLDSEDLALADNDPVATFPDTSGHCTVVQSNPAKQPIFKTGVQNGLPVVRYNGSTSELVVSGLLVYQPVTVVILASPAAGLNQTLMANTGLIYLQGGVFKLFFDGSDYSTVSGLADGTMKKIVLTLNGPNTKYAIDNDVFTTTFGADAQIDSTSIGAGSGRWLTGDIAHVSVYNTDLNLIETPILNAFLAKWGL